jgi:hypothetical protein
MNLLDRFVLQHLQPTLLRVEVVKADKHEGKQQEAKVELGLSPRMLQTDSGDEPPAYQVSARLSCRSGSGGKGQPMFKAQVAVEAVYQQISGEPVDIAEFTANHASLTRQIYPLLQQELRVLMNRVGLEQIRLPFDLAAQVDSPDSETVRVSGAVH